MPACPTNVTGNDNCSHETQERVIDCMVWRRFDQNPTHLLPVFPGHRDVGKVDRRKEYGDMRIASEGLPSAWKMCYM